MKKLIIIRHAQANHFSKGGDFERELTEHGQKCAVKAGKFLGKQDFKLQEIVSSSAARARQTAEIIAEKLDNAPKVSLTDELYNANTDTFRAFIGQLKDSTDSVAFVGHNPVLFELLNAISDTPVDKLRTCEIVVLDFEPDSWADCAWSVGRLALTKHPH